MGRRLVGTCGVGWRRGRAPAAALATIGVLAGLLAGAATEAGAGSEDCDGPPVTMRLESGDPPAGAADFEVSDGVARRVPILTGRDEPGRTQKELKKLAERASKTKLALYQIFLADFRIPRRDLTGPFASAFAMVVPEGDETAANLTIVPTKKRGFKAGDVVTFDDELEYETITTFASIGLGVVTAGGETGSGSPAGRVEVLAIDDDEICVDVDFELTDDDELVAAIEGVIAVPVVTSQNENLYFF